MKRRLALIAALLLIPAAASANTCAGEYEECVEGCIAGHTALDPRIAACMAGCKIVSWGCSDGPTCPLPNYCPVLLFEPETAPPGTATT